jgi:hypothetical protein
MSARFHAFAIGALLLLWAAGLVAVTRWLPPAAASQGGDRAAIGTCAARPPTGPGVAARSGTFFRLEPRLDAAGALIGQRLTVGRSGVGSGTADLGPGSAATGPTQGIVTMVDDDGATSHVDLVAAAGHCAITVYTSTDVVRRAILDPADGSVLLHLVARADRSDLGVWQVGPGETSARRMVEPLPAVLGLGRVWATDLRLDATGQHLAVQSCLDLQCLTRIVDLGSSTSTPRVIRGSEQGPMIGFSGGLLVTWAACDGFPCPVLAWDPAGGTAARTLIGDASAAALTGDARLLVVTESNEDGERTLALDPASLASATLHGLHDGERPLGSAAAQSQGVEIDASGVAVGTAAGSIRLIHVTADGEVLP